MSKPREASVVRAFVPSLGPIAVLALLAAALLLARDDSEWIGVAVVGTWVGTVTLVGALVSSRRPENPVGWLFLAAAVIISAYLFFEAYASYALELHAGSLPFGRAAAWMTLWLAIPGFGMFIFVFLLFPTGRLLSKRWRAVVYAAAGSLAAMSITFALKPGRVDNVTVIDNPLGLEAAGSVTGFIELVVWAPVVLALVSLVVRLRRAKATERQQMKWFVYAAALLPVLFMAGQMVAVVIPTKEDWLGFLLVMIGLLLIPVSIGMSILRYRLYDIDRIINRTLVYGLLTAVLAVVYAAGVVGLGGALRELTNQQDNNLAVAASTLAVAALFQPARTRIQSFIDRRFYRAKYDATKTLESFSGRLRDEVDLDSLTADLVGVVRETVHPAHVSLWLRDGRASAAILKESG